MTMLLPDTFSYGEDPNADPAPNSHRCWSTLVGPARNAEAVVKWIGEHRRRELRSEARYLAVKW